MPTGSEDSLCSAGRRDADGCETLEPEDAESAAASSQNAECEDLELTVCVCLTALGTHCSAQWGRSLSTNAGSMPDSTVIYSFLPALLAHYAAACTSSCSLCALSYLSSLHPDSLMQ